MHNFTNCSMGVYSGTWNIYLKYVNWPSKRLTSGLSGYVITHFVYALCQHILVILISGSWLNIHICSICVNNYSKIPSF